MELEKAKDLFLTGTKLLTKKKFLEAIKYFENSLEIIPDRPSTLRNLLICYINLDDLENSKKYLKLLIINKSNDRDNLSLLINVFKKKELAKDLKDFIENIEEEIEIKQIIKIQKDLIIPKLFKSEEQIKNIRQKLEKCVDEYLQNQNLEKHKLSNEILYSPKFNLSYDEYNNKNLFKKLTQLTRNIYPELKIVDRKVKKIKNQKIKIGFISEYLTDHTIGKLNFGLINKLNKKIFNVVIFHSSLTKKGLVLDNLIKLEKKGLIKNIFLSKFFEEGRIQIEKENLDILYFTDIGMSQDLYYYSYIKNANIQLTSWGHPITTGNEAINYFLSSNLLETENSISNYSEKLLLSKYLPMYFYKPQIKKKLSLGEMTNQNIYSCSQSLFKFHPKFDLILANILKKDKKAQIYLIKDINSILYPNLLDRFKNNNVIDLDRVSFLDPMNLEEFINFTGRSSVLLDPLFFGSGNSFHESMFYGTPTVTLPTNYLKSRIVNGAYKQMKIENPPVVSSEEDYVNLCIEIANMDKNKTLDIKNYFKTQAEKFLFENIHFVDDFENIMKNLVN